MIKQHKYFTELNDIAHLPQKRMSSISFIGYCVSGLLKIMMFVVFSAIQNHLPVPLQISILYTCKNGSGVINTRLLMTLASNLVSEL